MSNMSFPEKSTSAQKNPPNSKHACTPCFSSKSEELKWVFDKFDSNKDGKISLEEYKAALKAMDNKGTSTEAEAVKAFQVMDCDGDGFIDFKEFIQMFNGGGRVKETELKSAFQVFDLDGDGKISAQELCQVLKRLGEKGTTFAACKQMVKGVDSDGDGFIDFNEFSRMMITTPKIN